MDPFLVDLFLKGSNDNKIPKVRSPLPNTTQVMLQGELKIQFTITNNNMEIYVYGSFVLNCNITLLLIFSVHFSNVYQVIYTCLVFRLILNFFLIFLRHPCMKVCVCIHNAFMYGNESEQDSMRQSSNLVDTLWLNVDQTVHVLAIEGLIEFLFLITGIQKTILIYNGLLSQIIWNVF